MFLGGHECLYSTIVLLTLLPPLLPTAWSTDPEVLVMAIKDFVIQAVVQGLIAEVELQAWLDIEIVA